MNKYLVIYYAPIEAMGKMAHATEEEKQAGMKVWFDWKAAHEENIVDFGSPLMSGEGRGAEPTWHPSTKEVSGYSIVQATDLAAAKAIFENHPHVHWAPGCSIGVYEFAPM